MYHSFKKIRQVIFSPQMVPSAGVSKRMSWELFYAWIPFLTQPGLQPAASGSQNHTAHNEYLQNSKIYEQA